MEKEGKNDVESLCQRSLGTELMGGGRGIVYLRDARWQPLRVIVVN